MEQDSTLQSKVWSGEDNNGGFIRCLGAQARLQAKLVLKNKTKIQ